MTAQLGSRVVRHQIIVLLILALTLSANSGLSPVIAATTIRVEAGGSSSYTDTTGNVWAADNGFSGGSTVDRGAIAIANTNDDRLYQTERYGNPFSYAFSVANGTYTVNLHFAETYFTSSGQRVFSVAAEGATIISNLDIFVAAGGANTALIRTATVTVNDGQLNLNFTASVNNALVNGIEILDSAGATTMPTATSTPIPPTATPTKTNTPAGPTASATLSASNTPTNTAPPTNTMTRTNTPVGPTNTPTNTSVPPTATPTSGGSGNTHSGTWAIKGVLPATANFKNVSQVPSVTGSSTYVASIWIKGTGSVELSVKAGNWGASLTSVRCDATSAWQQCTTASFSTGSNAQLTFVIQNSYSTAGTVYIDDTFLGVSGGTNKLANPGLEGGSVNWTISDTTIWSIVQPAPGATDTPAPATATPTRTNTPSGPTATAPPSQTPTSTPTRTNTPIGPTATSAATSSASIRVDYTHPIRPIRPGTFGLDATGYGGSNKILPTDPLMQTRITALNLGRIRIDLEYATPGNPNSQIQCGGSGCFTNANGDQWINAIKAAGAEPVVVTHMYVGDVNLSVTDAVNLVRHFNVDTNNPVKRWILGNEQQMTTAEYISQFNQMYDAMKAVDSTLKIGGPAAASFNQTYLQNVLNGTGSRIDVMDFHQYGEGGTENLTEAQLLTKPPTYEANINTLRTMIQNTVPGRAAQIEIQVGEWNMNWNTQGSVALMYEQFNCVWTASAIGHMLNADGLSLLYGDKNLALGVLYEQTDDRMPAYYGIGMFTGMGLFPHFGATLATATTSLSNVEVYASDSPKNIVVINKDSSLTQIASLGFTGLASGVVDVWRKDKGVVATDPPIYLGTVTISNGQFSYSLPPYSVTTFAVR